MRKSILFIMLITVVMAISGCSKEKTAEITGNDEYSWLKPGTKLIYEVNYYGNVYDFKVTLEELGKSVKFYYEMLRQFGTVTITEEAMAYELTQKNSFSGEDIVLDDATTVFLSREVFSIIKKNGTISINPGSGIEYVDSSNIIEKPILIDGREIEYPLIHFITNGLSEYYVLDNDSFPLIISMVLDFSISLKEVITQ